MLSDLSIRSNNRSDRRPRARSGEAMTDSLRVPMEQVPACRVVLLRLAQRFEARARGPGGAAASRRRQPWLDAAAMTLEMAEQLVKEAR